MSQPTSPHAETRRHSPVRNPSTPPMRTVRKELLLLRAEVERSEFVRARAQLRASFERFGWLKLLLPRFPGARAKAPGQGINAKISSFVNHPLIGSLVSLLLAKPLRTTLAAGTKPLLKWGALGAGAWTAFRLLSRMIRRERGKSGASELQAK